VPSRRQPIHITLIPEMAAYPDLDSWLCRPLTKDHLRALSPEDRATRQRAMVRRAKARARLNAKLKVALSHRDAPTMTAGGVLRDVLHVATNILLT
jgi:hypothetical protein